MLRQACLLASQPCICPMEGKYQMLGFIEQDYVGKVTHEFKKISGRWRHQDWMQCGLGWITVSFIYKLAYIPQYVDINFNHFNHRFNLSWYKFKLLGWNDYKSMYTVYKQVYSATGITWSKCTHLHRQGCDNAQRQGVTQNQVSQQIGVILREVISE